MTMTMEDITIKGTDYHTALVKARDECAVSGENRYVCRTMLVDETDDGWTHTFIFLVVDDGYIQRNPWMTDIVARFEAGNKRRWWEITSHSVRRNLDEELPNKYMGSVEWSSFESGTVHIGE